ncbi:MAG: formylmethanofuran dehydrogenase subunit B [Gammaproteobacteria bacterium]|nr:formylmethanofuran dehydrogenase subunit B [Gammaproteobacteria bacterium]
MKTQTETQRTTITKEVTCPYCSLLCDDLVIQNDNETLKVIENGCHLARSGFENSVPSAQARIKGKNSGIDAAIKEAARILKRSKLPLIAGLGTDLAGMRAVMQLAEASGAVIDHMHNHGSVKNSLVLQDLGWIMTTLAEIRNRADLVIFAGTDATNYPRFYERVIHNRKTLFRGSLKNRQVVYIGEDLKTSKGRTNSGQRPIYIKCKQEHIGEIISVIHTMIVGDHIDSDVIHGVKLKTLVDLAQRMKEASYGVIVWAPGELTFPHAELTIQNFCELIKYLTRKTRFAGFSLGGNDGGTTAVNVSAWQCGYPLRVSFNKGYPEYDPHIYSASNVLKTRRVDSMLWISSISSDVKPPKAGIPSILLASPQTRIGYRPDVFIPVGTPGVDHKGHLFRTDSVVSLPLKQLRHGELYQVSDVLGKINELL